MRYAIALLSIIPLTILNRGGTLLNIKAKFVVPLAHGVSYMHCLINSSLLKDIGSVLPVDLNTKLSELKAKRRAIEEAIAALQNLKAEYRDKRSHTRFIPSRRTASSDRASSPVKIAGSPSSGPIYS